MKIPRPKRATCPSCGYLIAIAGDGRMRRHSRINPGLLRGGPLRKACPGGGMVSR